MKPFNQVKYRLSLLLFLKEERLLTKTIKYASTRHKHYPLSANTQNHDAKSVFDLFNWSSSLEGYIYWSNIYDQQSEYFNEVNHHFNSRYLTLKEFRNGEF